MQLLEAVAQYLHDRGLGVYDPLGEVEAADWSIFLEAEPPAPQLSITLYQRTTVGAGDSANPEYEDPRIVVQVRGVEDPRVSRDRAQAIYDALHGLGMVTLPGGLWLQLAYGDPAGVSAAGPDSLGRHTHRADLTLSIDKG